MANGTAKKDPTSAMMTGIMSIMMISVVAGMMTQTTPGTPTVTAISITPASKADLGVGATQQYTATALMSDGSTQDITATVTWASTIPTIATISTTGLATGVAAGVTSITATLGGIQGTTGLTVVAVVPPTYTVTLTIGQLPSNTFGRLTNFVPGNNVVATITPDPGAPNQDYFVIRLSGTGGTGKEFAFTAYSGVAFSNLIIYTIKDDNSVLPVGVYHVQVRSAFTDWQTTTITVTGI